MYLLNQLNVFLFFICSFIATFGYASGNIVPGSGYSTDGQQVAPEVCYNAILGSVSKSQSYINLSTATSFNELQRELKTDVSAEVGCGLFSGSVEAHYLRKMEDKDYSLSLNYYNYANANVAVELNGYGETVLNDQGKSLYADGKNPYFGLMCGDNYFSSYEIGAMLVMGVNLNFSSHDEKKQFEAEAKLSFGDIFSASREIQRIARAHNMHGSVSINALQKGGDPSQLSKILNKDPSGKYYVLTCDIQHMDVCKKAASGMLDYARNDFPGQFSFEKDIGLTPLGVGFAHYVPVNYVGIETNSLVTNQVKYDRLKLADELEKNKYYYQKVKQLLYGYPVRWDTDGDVYKNAQKLYTIAQDNIAIIMNENNPEEGVAGCYDTPDKCSKITKKIKSKLTPITPDDLVFLEPIKFIVTGFGPTTGWFPVALNKFKGLSPFFPDPREDGDIIITAENMKINTRQHGGIHDYRRMVGTFRLVKENTYHGIGIWDGGTEHLDTTAYVKINPFYFEAYKSKINFDNDFDDDSTDDGDDGYSNTDDGHDSGNDKKKSGVSSKIGKIVVPAICSVLFLL